MYTIIASDWITKKEAAEILGCTKDAIKGYVRRGSVQKNTDGLVSRSDIMGRLALKNDAASAPAGAPKIKSSTSDPHLADITQVMARLDAAERRNQELSDRLAEIDGSTPKAPKYTFAFKMVYGDNEYEIRSGRQISHYDAQKIYYRMLNGQWKSLRADTFKGEDFYRWEDFLRRFDPERVIFFPLLNRKFYFCVNEDGSEYMVSDSVEKDGYKGKWVEPTGWPYNRDRRIFYALKEGSIERLLGEKLTWESKPKMILVENWKDFLEENKA